MIRYLYFKRKQYEILNILNHIFMIKVIILMIKTKKINLTLNN